MTARRVLLSFVVVSFLAAPAAAENGPQGAKVLVFPMSGTVPNDPGDGLVQLTRLLARSAGLVGEVKISGASFTDAATLAGCETEDAACFDKVAETLHVDQLVLATAEAGADGTTVDVKIQQFDKSTGLVEEHSDTLPAASFDELKTAFLRSSTRAFVGSDAQPPPERPIVPPPVETPPVQTPSQPVAPVVDETEPAFDLHRVGKVPWIVAGSGVVLAGVGAVFLIMAQSRQDDVDSAPTQTAADLDRLKELEDEGETYNTVGNVLFIGGAAVAIGGGVWAAILATRRPHHETEAAPAPAVSFAPLALPGGGGFSLSVPIP